MEFEAKPKDKDGFKSPVSWLVGRDLIAGLKLIALYTAFKGKIDPRDWMKPRVFGYKDQDKSDAFWRGRNHRAWKWKIEHDGFWKNYAARHPDFWKANGEKEFWFDYIADSGDGQMATYNVAYLCLSDMWANKAIGAKSNDWGPPAGAEAEVRFSERARDDDMLLPRGQFLFVGGDTAYHIADYSTISDRFQNPFRWAFASLRSSVQNWLKEQPDEVGNIPLKDSRGKVLRPDSEPRRPIFAVPGNHDYYDVIDGFNRQFRRPATPEHGQKLAVPQLSLPGFERYQDASYVALHLPFDWWFLGLDTEISELDLRQQVFFSNLKDPKSGQLPAKLIIATPEPTTVFRRCKPEDDKTLQAFKQLGLPRQCLKGAPPQEPEIVPPGQCRLDLSGDVHHYARYLGPANNSNASAPSAENYASVVSGGGGAFHDSTTTQVSDGIEEQALYPSKKESLDKTAPRLFDLKNIYDGGYVWLFGSIVTGIIYFAATITPTSTRAVEWFLNLIHLPFQADDRLPWFEFVARYDPTAYWWSSLLLLLALVPLGWGMGRFGTIIKKLILAPVWNDEKEMPKPPPESKYSALGAIALMIPMALALYVSGIRTYMADAKTLHPFSDSLLILYHFVLATGLIVLSVQDSAWLAHRAKFFNKSNWANAPMTIVSVIAVVIVLFGVWMFGYHSAAYALSDIIFALVLIGLLVALGAVAAFVAGELQKWKGKAFLAPLGIWHAVLQLSVPFLLVRVGDWRAVLLALAVIALFSGIPKTSSLRGVGARLTQWESPAARWILTLFWLVYGGTLLVLPLWFHDRAQHAFNLDGRSFVYSSFLPQNWIDGLSNWLSNALGPNFAMITILGISFLAALALGFILSMSWLSWYFGVAFLFNGHNNEVGGAARIEEFKHIVRIRLREKDLTAFVIAVDDPTVNGSDLKPKLADVFQLKAQ